jgi:hypothetical protein
MKDKNPAKTVMADEGSKAGAPARQEHTPTEVAQKPMEEPAPPAGIERRFRQTDLPAHFIERRRHPRIRNEQPPVPAPPRFEDY